MSSARPEPMIRRYREGEESAIWQVVFEATHVSNARDYHPDLIERWAPRDRDMDEWAKRLRKSRPWVAVVGEVIAGMAELEPSGYIDYFYVHPEHQARGVGTALMERLEAEAAVHGAAELTANVSVTARPFFEARGFRITKVRSKVILGHPAPNFAMAKVTADSESAAPRQFP